MPVPPPVTTATLPSSSPIEGSSRRDSTTTPGVAPSEGAAVIAAAVRVRGERGCDLREERGRSAPRRRSRWRDGRRERAAPPTMADCARYLGLGANSAHHPFGLILPSTSLQLSGATKWRQSEHFWLFFGVSWYCTSFGAIFCWAADRVEWSASAAAASGTARRPASRSIRREMHVRGRPIVAMPSILLACRSSSPAHRVSPRVCPGAFLYHA